MSKVLINISSLYVSYGRKSVLENLYWSINKNENWVLAGEIGSGKSTLGKAIANEIAFEGIIELNTDIISQGDISYLPNWYQFTNIDGDKNFYYQQRYIAQQRRDTLTVKAELKHFAAEKGLDYNKAKPLIEQLGYADLLNAHLIELSSGEHKKLQIVKAFWENPRFLILDEPYTGLDKASRISLNNIIDEYVLQGNNVLLISNETQLPEVINKKAIIDNGQMVEISMVEQPYLDNSRRAEKFLPDFLSQAPSDNIPEVIVEMKDISVSYGEKKVLKDISWKIKKGEKWLVQGPNGSGKSTLLSLVNADHPQAYGLDLSLFGNRRGSGESIWDIKKKIGIISPEMHWYFDQNATVYHTIASGFYDSNGWFLDVKYNEHRKIEQLLDFFDLTKQRDEKLFTLSLGKQRLAMLARTIIKNPPLLVLDEPCQGLDRQQADYFNRVVDEISSNGNTLIYIGHYESQIPKCIDHQLLLEEGEIKDIKNLKLQEEYLGK